MTAFDYIVLSVLGLSIIVGLMRGAIRELFSVFGWLLAFYVAKTWNPTVLPYVPSQIPSDSLKVIAAFIAIFLLVLLCASLISIVLTSIMKAAGLGGVNRLLGGFVGSVRGLILILIIMILASMTNLPKDPRWTNAMLSAPLEALVLKFRPWLPESIASKVHFGKPSTLIDV